MCNLNKTLFETYKGRKDDSREGGGGKLYHRFYISKSVETQNEERYNNRSFV